MEKHLLFLVYPTDLPQPLGPFEACWDTEELGDGSSPRIEVRRKDRLGVVLGPETPEYTGARFRATAVDGKGDYVGELACEVV